MAALQPAEKCSRTNVYAPLFQQLDALPSTIGYGFKTDFGRQIRSEVSAATGQKVAGQIEKETLQFCIVCSCAVGAVFNRD